MTTTSTAMPFILQLVSVIFMVGSIWGAILLLKDSIKHKKFAKVIRIIAGVIQLLSILGSIIIISVVYLNPQTVTSWTGLTMIMTIIAGIGFISIITNIRGGILLFTESKRNVGFKKWIRIICGIIMIVSLIMSFLTTV
ncbi:MAG: hypothetical protein WC875_04055 [Candidatus Absconditabacterales bacterium]